MRRGRQATRGDRTMSATRAEGRGQLPRRFATPKARHARLNPLPSGAAAPALVVTANRQLPRATTPPRREPPPASNRRRRKSATDRRRCAPWSIAGVAKTRSRSIARAGGDGAPAPHRSPRLCGLYDASSAKAARLTKANRCATRSRNLCGIYRCEPGARSRLSRCRGAYRRQFRPPGSASSRVKGTPTAAFLAQELDH